MTALAIRSCVSCAHFLPGRTSYTGRCAHPAHQSLTDATIFQREGGLGCHQGLGKNDWEPRTTLDGARVAALLVWGPFHSPAPAFDNLPPDLLRLLIAAADDSTLKTDLGASTDDEDDDATWVWSLITGR